MIIERLNEKSKLIKNKTPFVTYDIFDDIDFAVAGFSTRMGGVSEGCFSSMNLSFGRGDSNENVLENFKLMATSAGFEVENVCLPNQCHTDSVRVVTDSERGSGILTPKVSEPYDAQITNIPGITLICYGADCVPVYLCDTENKAIGLAHAGWKGSVLNIVQATILKMKEIYGTNPTNIKVVIGPSICQKCYEVSEDVATQFIEKYKPNSDAIIKKIDNYQNTNNYQNINSQPSLKKSNSILNNDVVIDIGNGKYLLGLWKANYINLINAGVLPENIVISGLCTKCNHEMFFSHRKHHDKRGTNAAFMYISK